MNENGEQRPHILAVLVFSTAVLGTVHLLGFVWMTAFVYHSNIRGYVPAGVASCWNLLGALVVLLIYLAWLGRKEGRTRIYVLVGCLGGPLAVFGANLYSIVLVRLLGYTLERDIAVSAIGVILFAATAAIVHRTYLGKRNSVRDENREDEES